MCVGAIYFDIDAGFWERAGWRFLLLLCFVISEATLLILNCIVVVCNLCRSIGD